jgi:WD40 repeat protein
VILRLLLILKHSLLTQIFLGDIFLSFFQIEGHDDDVNTVAFADSTSQILYSGGDDGLCKVSSVVIYISVISSFD